MSFISNTAFQPRNWNARNEDLQNITGLYGAWSGSDFVGADASAGLLCNIDSGNPDGGRYMVIASDGSKTLYAVNPADVYRITDGDNTWAVSNKTLGNGIPADTKDTFTELRVGETYAFGPGNFSTLVTTTDKYATVTDGLLVGTSTEPSSGFYFELDTTLGIDTFTEGNYNAFDRYNLVLKQA